ncbi:MAG TPA: AraC family transcriptional regulator [Candidatus Butyricimonas faecavium]|nr:AraC family transcriptional regulator [Candidatus Butyricimonas faecavium]
MMNRELAEAFAFSIPVLGALGCMIMLLLDACAINRNKQEKRLRLFLALTYGVTSLGWFGLVLYIVSPGGFIYYHTVFLMALMFDQVMFYRFVAVITGTGRPRKFSRLHILIPLFLTGISAVSDLLVTGEKQMGVVYGEAEQMSDGWFHVVFMLTTVIFVVYNTVYPLLSLRNIYRYRRFVVDYSSDVQHTSLDWLFVMQVLILICVPVPLAGLLLNIEIIASSWFVWLGALPYFAYYMILCYNMLDENYLIVQSHAEEDTESFSRHVPFDRKYFERYVREKKPYLNPKLRITDLATELKTNRSYLSTFINCEYGMNFSRFVNRCRLNALDRLRVAPENADKCNMELVLMAGFNGYRNYLRVKNEEDGRNLLREFE